MLRRLKSLLSGAAPEAMTPPPPTVMDPDNSPVAANFTFEDARLSGWFSQQTGELLKGFPIRAEDSVLDVGCGDGTFINFCAQFGAEITFADIDAEKILQVEARLRQSAARALHPLVTDANPLPLPDAYASKVIAMEVMEHVDDPAQFLRELVRVGKPGALYLLSVPDAVSEGVQQELAPPTHFQKPNHINIFTREEFERLVLDSGLVIEKKATYGFYWAVWWAFFWTCDQDLAPPWHPLLENWARTWEAMLKTPDGPRIKSALDKVMPKSQAIIARKPE